MDQLGGAHRVYLLHLDLVLAPCSSFLLLAPPPPAFPPSIMQLALLILLVVAFGSVVGWIGASALTSWVSP